MAGMAATGRADRRPILVVDDDVKIVRLVRTYLERAGYRVVEATDGRSALAAIALEMPILVVLDVMLPEVDGLAVLRAVRRTDRTPVIILSARGLVDDRIAGLTAGADDYLPKPFSPAELVLRVERILERSEPAAVKGPIHHGDLVVDRDRHEVRVRNQLVGLTSIEFRLLVALLEADGRVLTRDQLLDAVYGQDEAGILDRTVDVHIGRLRDKLGDNAERATLRRNGPRRRLSCSARRAGRRRRVNRDRAVIRRPGGIASQIALAALLVAGIAIAILVVGVLVVGGQSFANLMAEHGESADSSREMFMDSVGWVVVGTIIVAVAVAMSVASLLGARLALPLRDMDRAARQIAAGDYRARIPRKGPEEIVSLSDSFNQMAAALEEQERMRREFIANAAHELRTPLTNLQGYLEALRDGVIDADPATFESLLEESERLVRLSRSLDTLAAGDAGGAPATVDLDLARLIRSAVDLARPGIVSGGLELSVDVPTDLPARGDPDQLAQVLSNLLQNAVRYTPSGGRIDVTGGTASGRRPRVGDEYRGRDPQRGPAARLRALLSSREVT